MTDKLKAVLAAAACLVCCIPLVLGALGATTGIAGAVGIWFRRYDLAFLGLIAVMVVVVRDGRSRPREGVDRQ